jgi:hypothetical protein
MLILLSVVVVTVGVNVAIAEAAFDVINLFL